MSRVFSMRDLRLIPALSKFNEIELLQISNDALVNSYLRQLGFNISRAILYTPAKHRDLQGNVGVGFRAVGEISRDRSFLTSSLCTTTERLVAASYYDMSLTKELAKLLGNSVDLRSGVGDEEDSSFPAELIEPDYEEVAFEILALEKIRDSIRGTPHNDAGALKTPGEYAAQLLENGVTTVVEDFKNDKGKWAAGIGGDWSTVVLEGA